MTLNGTVLITDDDPEMVRALAIHCQKLGLDVDTAENGIAAILKAKKNPPASPCSRRTVQNSSLLSR